MSHKSPFQYFGGKRRAAHLVWPRFGDVPNYVEPFAGSLAILLARPTPARIEIVNDMEAFICNFWRALKNNPEAVADYAIDPVNEADFSARHRWLHAQTEFTEKMKTDPDYYDPKIAGWWVWGQCLAIGGGWQRDEYNSIPNSRKRGVFSERIASIGIQQEFTNLARRLQTVQVTCGDWSRVVKPSYTTFLGTTGILLDPPYYDGLSDDLYRHSDANVSANVRQWAIENGSNPQLLIALCGYEGEHDMPSDWETVIWEATGGYGSISKDGENRNAERERIWFSPHCLKVNDSLFADYTDDEKE